ncbi:hypothetical protein [Streptomyces sp. NPDC004267]|uniref:hypothetical protein n=1 Tax=Streptomyces sp. NPDC004267 TaxID=3364694 RepID=UPI00368FB4B9
MNHPEIRGKMTDAGKIDEDAVLRARVLLLGSDRPTRREEVEAYRVLARVSPLTYLPKLAGALILLGYEARAEETKVALHAEAADAVRRLPAGVPARAELMQRALGAYERSLFGAGRRAEGRAVCEELAESGRGGRLPEVRAEEGRHREAAALLGAVAAEAAEVSDWTVYPWAAELSAAGLHEEAVDAFALAVTKGRRKAAEDDTPLAGLVWELVHHAGLLDEAGRPGEAGAARREALELLVRLAADGEPKSWSNILHWWVTLFTLSGRAAEPAASPAAPMPPFGAAGHEWSPDTREAYVAGIPALEAEAAALAGAGDGDHRLPERYAVHRRLTLRRSFATEWHGHRIEEPLRPLFDEGVALARRLAGTRPAALPQALTDRAMFLVAVGRFGEALDDYREAIVTHA